MKKYIFTLLAILLALFFLYPTQSPKEQYTKEGWKTYTSTKFAFSFMYPPRYSIIENSVQSNTLIYTTITLIDLRNGTSTLEAPPNIVFAIYPNGRGLQLLPWLEQEKSSNYNLKHGEVKTKTIARKEGLIYSWSGLYEGDSVALSLDKKILLVTGTWIKASDMIRTDFTNILKTIVIN